MALKDIKIAKSAMDDTIYAGYVDKSGSSWKSKVDVTNQIIRCVIERWGGFKQQLNSSDGKKYEITIKEIT